MLHASLQPTSASGDLHTPAGRRKCERHHIYGEALSFSASRSVATKLSEKFMRYLLTSAHSTIILGLVKQGERGLTGMVDCECGPDVG